MSIGELVRRRGISEVLHFTTNFGLTGILDSGYLRSRKRIADDERLEFILKLNSRFRKDEQWLDHVSMSISRINSHFFTRSGRWHIGIWWCVLSFDPIILSHPGVYFATTNNIYTGVVRNNGPNGLEAIFAETIVQYVDYSRKPVRIVTRPKALPSHYPTCEQAEVLYPEQISTEHLRRIYVTNGEDADDAAGQVAGLAHRPIQVVINPDLFGFPT